MTIRRATFDPDDLDVFEPVDASFDQITADDEAAARREEDNGGGEARESAEAWSGPCAATRRGRR